MATAPGPVYVNTPVELLYANDPLPPASVTETNPRTSEESTEILPDARSIPNPPAKCALASDAEGPVYVNLPLAES